MRLSPNLPDTSDSSQDEPVFFHPLTFKDLEKHQIDLEDRPLNAMMSLTKLPEWFQSRKSGINLRADAINLYADAVSLCNAMAEQLKTVMRKGSCEKSTRFHQVD